ncbi:sulfurtransferase [Erythrobacter insulae]|uniref:Sulfurtransferase n=1 Tax=Erythrobacter insulae TaxID=2584124 RepID=A0A547P958_9SPHN|nr:sulfurtransferase [Erythrobacter insulae]TRD10685.1 sulfurtransferase [Erythrobacter insulae]
MTNTFPSLVSTQWLAENLGNPELVVIDASRHLPAANRDAHAEYEKAHIPGARFLDLASLTDTASPVPAAMPSARQLANRLDDLGITSSSKIVLYDDSDVKTSARAWFILVSHGIDSAAILDGGFGKWRTENRPVERVSAKFVPIKTDRILAVKRVASKAEVLANVDRPVHQVLDARSAERVFGAGTDPVHGGENGRIPGSLNLPFGAVFAEDGTYKSPDDLRAAFEAAGIDLSRPVITSCGSGVTASVLLFALNLIGKHDTALYDGSWMEWSADPETPKEQGPA